jgi:opacity protein-like surface antigen
MKTNVLTAALLGALALGGIAEAKEVEKGVTLRAASVDFMDSSRTQYGIGYGFSSFGSSGFVWGTDFELDYFDVEGKEVWGYGAALRLGYAMAHNDLQLYALGGALGQSMPGGNGYGFGYGGGADYRLFSHFRIGAEYRTYSMTREYGDYDYTQISGFGRIVW